METAAKQFVWVILCGCLMPTRPCRCAVTACVNEDRFIVINAVPPVETLGFEVKSAGGFLVPMSDPATADPYTFVLSNTNAVVTWGALGAPVILDGDWVTPVGYDGRTNPVTDLSVRLGAGAEVPAGTVTGFCHDTLRGDFNLDEVVDLLDIDLLGREIAARTHNALYDLNRDTLVNQEDLTLFLGGNIISDGNRINGDADFDGSVGFADFLVLSANFDQFDRSWSEGDFVPNGHVGFGDFLVIARNFGAMADPIPATPVPEPQAWVLLLVGFSVLRCPSRRSHAGRSPAKSNRERERFAWNVKQ